MVLGLLATSSQRYALACEHIHCPAHSSDVGFAAHDIDVNHMELDPKVIGSLVECGVRRGRDDPRKVSV